MKWTVDDRTKGTEETEDMKSTNDVLTGVSRPPVDFGAERLHSR